MKITNILLWGAGIGAAIWGIGRLMKPKVDPATGLGGPGRTAGAGTKDGKTNFTGTPKKRFDLGFNGGEEGLNDGANNLEGFDLMTGESKLVIKTKLPPRGIGSGLSLKKVVKAQTGKPLKWVDKDGNVWYSRTGNVVAWGPEGPVLSGKVKKDNTGKVIEWTDSKGNNWSK